MTIQNIRRGDIWIAEIDNNCKFLLRGRHPVIILSNYKACNHSPILNIIPITSKNKLNIPAHVHLGRECGLDMDSTALCEQLLPISRQNLLYQIGKCSLEKMDEIKKAIDNQLGFATEYKLDVFEDIKRMLDNIQELDGYLLSVSDIEVLKEREIAIKCLERYCINHSVSLDINKYTNAGDGSYVRAV